MAGMVGMNVEEVRNLSRQMDNVAQQIDEAGRQITSMLSSTSWEGNDRRSFEGDWTGQHMSAISHVVTAVRQASTTAARNADDQEQVSNA